MEKGTPYMELFSEVHGTLRYARGERYLKVPVLIIIQQV